MNQPFRAEKSVLIVAVLISGLASTPLPAAPVHYNQLETIAPEPRSAGDAFGWTLDIDGDVTVISRVDFTPADGVDASGVFVYRRIDERWAFEAQLKPRDTVPVNLGVAAVAVSGDFVVIGTPYGGSNREGRAYLWGRDAASGRWQQVRVLRSSRPAPDAAFGGAVDIDGNTLVVGATNEAVSPGVLGAAHIFQRGSTGWRHQRRVTAVGSSRSIGAFGDAVALDASRLVVGAPFSTADNGREDAGVALVFERNAGGSGRWGQVARLQSLQADEADACGASVAVSGSLVAFGCDTAKQVWVYDAATPNRAPFLIKDPTQDAHGIGRKLDFEGGRLVAGAPAEYPDVPGLVFAFDCRALPVLTCSLYDTLERSPEDTRFGWEVAIDDAGNIAVAGADPESETSRLGGVFVLREP
ncbi:MAG: repeat-containing protein [Panacagrimonas sp.]|jgi:hypothetical protein|nr:hypothetical protein [Panacagrimonas sp.]MCC2656988.1 repeat-containing protein [Panacagrimonas sp.]